MNRATEALRHTIALALILGTASLCWAKGGKLPTFVNSKSAGVDYQLQGEYAGDAGGTSWGAQVIALGKGKFRIVGYAGGLPGAGWDGSDAITTTGSLEAGVVNAETDQAKLAVDGKTLQVLDFGDNILGTLEKKIRKSDTLKKAAPEGAVVLFDGKNTDQWNNAKLVQKKLLGATGCFTKAKFGDHHLHLEFRTPFMPTARGQARGNSGVYIQSRYELQVLDSFGLAGKNNECGGFYQVARPKVNMCLPPLAWQTYDIDFTAAKYEGDKKVANARVTVRHNGVVIHENLELPRHTPGRHKEAAGPDGLFLQDHGNPVAYRNVWILEK